MRIFLKSFLLYYIVTCKRPNKIFFFVSNLYIELEELGESMTKKKQGSIIQKLRNRVVPADIMKIQGASTRTYV